MNAIVGLLVDLDQNKMAVVSKFSIKNTPYNKKPPEKLQEE